MVFPKGGWTIVVVFIPVLGVFAYLIARGGRLGEHQADYVQRTDQLETIEQRPVT